MSLEPRFDYGQHVRVTRTIRNDGSYFGKRSGEALVRCGLTGFVKNVGTFLQDQVIYEVHFIQQDMVVGIRETELQDADEPWIETLFQNRDHVINRVPMAINGKIVMPSGSKGQVVKMISTDPSSPILYHVSFSGRTFQIPEGALTLDEVECEKSATGCSSCSLSDHC
ncbi:MAG: nitrogen fixation protein NifZ [Magnetococcales bacterium]|nr:nitrogen fixation protein NifZ [Magnetococcales bacterium]